MKALKYGLALMLGLSMLGFSARVQAQSSGQTAEVVPAHATPLPEVPAVQEQTPPQDVQADEELQQRGMPTPREIEKLMDKGDFETAIKEFDKFIKTAKGDPCDLIYLPLSFYMRLSEEDTANSYKGKVDSYLNQFMKTCGNTVDAYMLQERVDYQGPAKTVERMTQAMKYEPDYVVLYTMRGDALWQLNRAKEACADFAKAKELGDDSASMFLEVNCSEQE